jgi:hypothetical protein
MRRIMRPMALGSFSSTLENSRSIWPMAASILGSSFASPAPEGPASPSPARPGLVTAKAESIFFIR